MIVLAVVVYAGCEGVPGLETATENQDVTANAALSRIDSKPIVEMSANEFYTGSAQYFKDAISKIAANKALILDSYREYLQNARADGITDPAATLVELKKQPAFVRAVANSNSKKAIEDLPGHIRIKNNDHETENFYLSLTLHSPPVKRLSETAAGFLSGAGENRKAYIALDVDQFYASDGPDGEEIWPVTIPAVSLDDEQQVEIVVHKDGRLQWPQAGGLFATMSAPGTETETESIDGDLFYMSAETVSTSSCTGSEICFDDGSGTGGGDGGDDGSGGGPSSPPAWTEEMPVFTVQHGTFLALKSVRLHERRETGGAAEVLMQTQEIGDDPLSPEPIKSEWAYAFDRKQGVYGKVGFLRRVKFRGLFDAIFDRQKLFDRIFNNQNQNLPIFDGTNSRNMAVDHTVYEVPDVNEPGITYHFTNMRRWKSSGILQNNIGQPFQTRDNFGAIQTFQEIAPQDYLPLVELGDIHTGGTLNFRLMMHEDDTNYQHYANADQSNGIAVKFIQTFDMQDGIYKGENTSIRSKSVLFSSSDDTYGRSGVKNITQDFVEDRMQEGNNEITAEFQDFRYVFTTVTSRVFCEPDN